MSGRALPADPALAAKLAHARVYAVLFMMRKGIERLDREPCTVALRRALDEMEAARAASEASS